MKTQVRTINGVAIVVPTGKLMGGEETSRFDEKLYALLGRGTREAVIDLGHVDWINSTGLSSLIRHWHEFRDRGAELHLANLTKKTEDVLVVSRLSEVFKCHETLPDALRNFARGKAGKTAA